MIPLLSDRNLVGGPLFFELPVESLSESDLASLKSDPKRELVKVKMYANRRRIPICNEDHHDEVPVTIHPNLRNQSYVICKHNRDHVVVKYFAELPTSEPLDTDSLNYLIDEIRPQLLFQASEDLKMTPFELMNHISDIHYHIEPAK